MLDVPQFLRGGGRVVAWGGLVGLAACGPAPALGPAPVATDPCLVAAPALAPSPPSAVTGDTVVVIAPGPLDPEPTRQGTSDVARLVARQLYASLVRIDCQGRVRPSIAERWRADSGGSTWYFELSDGLRFADGSPLDAASVVASWHREGRLGGGAPIAAAVSAGSRTVVVALAAPAAEVPRWLGDPAHGIGGAPWPDGRPAESGAYRAGPRGNDGAVVLEPRAGGAVVLVRGLPPAVDPRDRLVGPRPADLLLTRDPAAVRFGAARGFAIVPLGWDVRHELVVSPGMAPQPAPSAADLALLAAEAVRGDVRPALSAGPSCPARNRGPAASRRAVAYRAADPIARDLAERIAALSGRADPPAWLPPGAAGRAGWTALPLSGPALDTAVAQGTTVAAIVSRPVAEPIGCESGALAQRIPLLESRATAIRTGPRVALHLDADGMVTLEVDRP